MRKKIDQKILKGLQQIPGVGPSLADKLILLGITKVSDLKGVNPEELYQRLCKLKGQHVDRCVLYVFRCAVYYASHDRHDPNLLRWWNWKD